MRAHIKIARTPIRSMSAVAILLAGSLQLSCGDSTGPEGGPQSLALELPDFAADGQPFQLKVTALGNDPSQPLVSSSGTVQLTVSSGTIVPQSLQLAGGVGAVAVTITGATGRVTITATMAQLERTGGLEILAAGQLLAGAASEPAETAIPDLPFTARPEDYSDTHPQLPGLFLSFNTLLVVFELGTTVAEANAALGPLDGEIVGGIRGVAGQAAGILFIRLLTTTHEEIDALLAPVRANPKVRAVAPDVLLAPRVISRSNNGTPADWTWTDPPGGGNWGLELIRVPHMWNLNAAIQKSPIPNIRTGIFDVGFSDTGEHPDLVYTEHLSPGEKDDHGTHVAGIVGATLNSADNNNGIDGLNPFARLVVKALVTRSTGAEGLIKGASWGQGFVSELDGFLRTQPNLRVLNISLGYPWEPPAVNTSQNLVAQALATAHGHVHKAMLDNLMTRGFSLPLMVTAAGNESSSIAQQAMYGSPMNYAALALGAANTVVVEALDNSEGSAGGATRSALSNHNGHVSAPGGAILSTVLAPALYGTKGGTSLAAPHVAGLAGFLLTVDPGLSTAQLRELLLSNTVPVAGGASPRIDAFAAVMDIDRVRGNDRVLRMLVDIDDGTEDGNRRTDPDEGSDYVETDADGDGGIGDGSIDMSDFRRWRDWHLALFQPDELSLDGGDRHPKKDLNGNGAFAVDGDDELLYPRIDLNGDGWIDLVTKGNMPGAINADVNDLEVLKKLFTDPHYDAADLDDLAQSADIAIRPAILFDGGEAVDIHSSVRPAGAVAAEDDPRFRRTHTGSAADGAGLWQVYTVPVSDAGYTARVIGVDAQGDTIVDVEKDFTAKPGQDHFWDPADVYVVVLPGAVTVSPGQKVQFTATVTGADNPAVIWSAAGGTISPDGLYTAGPTPGDYSVTAASVAAPTASAQASVTIAPPASVVPLRNRSFSIASVGQTVDINVHVPPDRANADPADFTGFDAEVGTTISASAEWSDRGTVSASASAQANQSAVFELNSETGGLIGMHGSGSVKLNAEVTNSFGPWAIADGQNTIWFDFRVTERPVEFTVTGSCTASPSPGLTILIQETEGGDFDRVRLGGGCSYNKTGVMPPGRYEINVTHGPEVVACLNGGDACSESKTYSGSFEFRLELRPAAGGSVR